MPDSASVKNQLPSNKREEIVKPLCFKILFATSERINGLWLWWCLMIFFWWGFNRRPRLNATGLEKRLWPDWIWPIWIWPGLICRVWIWRIWIWRIWIWPGLIRRIWIWPIRIWGHILNVHYSENLFSAPLWCIRCKCICYAQYVPTYVV
jgi:hypothetical protein